jgi:hypothetical protein
LLNFWLLAAEEGPGLIPPAYIYAGSSIAGYGFRGILITAHQHEEKY